MLQEEPQQRDNGKKCIQKMFKIHVIFPLGIFRNVLGILIRVVLQTIPAKPSISRLNPLISWLTVSTRNLVIQASGGQWLTRLGGGLVFAHLDLKRHYACTSWGCTARHNNRIVHRVQLPAI